MASVLQIGCARKVQNVILQQKVRNKRRINIIFLSKGIKIVLIVVTSCAISENLREGSDG